MAVNVLMLAYDFYNYRNFPVPGISDRAMVFHYFFRLSLELRAMIWIMAAEGEDINIVNLCQAQLEWEDYGQFETGMGALYLVPPTLHACTESRHLLLPKFERFVLDDKTFLEYPVYFRPDKDVIYIDDQPILDALYQSAVNNTKVMRACPNISAQNPLVSRLRCLIFGQLRHNIFSIESSFRLFLTAMGKPKMISVERGTPGRWSPKRFGETSAILNRVKEEWKEASEDGYDAPTVAGRTRRRLLLELKRD